jgi:hypothetical protein
MNFKLPLNYFNESNKICDENNIFEIASNSMMSARSKS